MKLLSQNKYKKVDYFNIELVLPESVKYLVTTAQGEVWGSNEEPEADLSCGWTFGYYSYQEYMGQVDLEGMDWKDTLMCL